MKRMLICYILLFMACVSYSETMADDCKTILQQAESKTSLLEKNKILEAGMAQCSNDHEWNYAYAYSLERLRKYQDAAKYYKKAISINNTNANYYIGLGDVLKNIGNYSEAADAYKNAMRINPNDQRLVKELETISAMIPKKEVSQVKTTELQDVKAKELTITKENEKNIENISITMQTPYEKPICSLNMQTLEQQTMANIFVKYSNGIKEKNNMDLDYFKKVAKQ